MSGALHVKGVLITKALPGNIIVFPDFGEDPFCIRVFRRLDGELSAMILSRKPSFDRSVSPYIVGGDVPDVYPAPPTVPLQEE